MRSELTQARLQIQNLQNVNQALRRAMDEQKQYGAGAQAWARDVAYKFEETTSLLRIAAGEQLEVQAKRMRTWEARLEQQEDEVLALQRQLKTSRALSNQLAADSERQQAELEDMQRRLEDSQKRAKAKVDQAEIWQGEREREMEEQMQRKLNESEERAKAKVDEVELRQSEREAGRVMRSYLNRIVSAKLVAALRKWMELLQASREAEQEQEARRKEKSPKSPVPAAPSRAIGR